MSTKIPNWSISKLFMYEACPYRYKLRYIDKVPEPPLPPDNPMARGSRIHDNLEQFVQGKAELNNEAKALTVFEPALYKLKELYVNDQAITEDDWFFNSGWDSCSREDVWLWAKLDFLAVSHDDTSVVIGDYKSGKSAYKAIEHVQQLQLYAACATIKYPDADVINAELWYVDEGHILQHVFSKEQALKFVGRFDKRAQRIYDDKYYRPNPNKHTCRYCPYGPKNLGVCPVGV